MTAKETSLDPEKYPALEPKDEDFIKTGIHKAETSSIHSTASSAPTDEDNDDVPANNSTFNPTRTLYILRHNLFSKEVGIIDITNQTSTPYTGGEISDAFRDAARGLTEDKARAANPAYQLKRKHWYSKTVSMTSPTSPTPGTELASWKHGGMSFSKAELSFPASSAHSTHALTMAPVRRFRRTNAFVQDSVEYMYKCDSRFKANRITLLKKIGGRQVVVARYAQRWGSWITGGVLLVDGGEVDEVVAVLTTCVMLRRMQQRAAERTKYTGGGGGGGGGD